MSSAWCSTSATEWFRSASASGLSSCRCSGQTESRQRLNFTIPAHDSADRQFECWQIVSQSLAHRQAARYGFEVIYHARHVEGVIAEALADTRIVIVNGARQSGKSTAVHRLVRDLPGVIERKLDRPNDLTAARLDATEFVAHDGLLVIDEIQRAPELILPIKARVDADNRPGQFLLTGSARLLGLHPH